MLMTLDQDQIKYLEEKLLSEKSSLENQLANIMNGTDFGNDIDHLEEEADETEEIATRFGIKVALEERLQNIKTAMEKIVKGNYGFCEKCGQEIDFKLLQVIPESKLCRECKKS